MRYGGSEVRQSMNNRSHRHAARDRNISQFILPAALVLAALMIGLFMPSAVSGIQDRRTDRSAESFSTGTLNLKLIDNDAIAAKLDIILEHGEELELKNGKYMTHTQAEQTLPAMLDILRHAGMNYAPPEYFRCTGAHPILLVSSGDEADTYIVWAVNAEAHYDGMCYALDYVIDDETGTVLGMNMYWYFETEGETPPEEEVTMSASERATRGMAAAKAIAKVLPDCLPLVDVTYSAQSTVLDNYFYIAVESGGEYIYSIPVYINDDSWSVNIEK